MARAVLFGIGVFMLSCVPLAAQDTYYAFWIDQDQLQGAPDFSRLNHPLSLADRVFIRDGHFYRVGMDQQPNTPDDERLRFAGINLCFSANFPEASDGQRIARRLRRLGVNLVRLHHMDGSPDSNPSQANSLLTTASYPTLNSASVTRLRSFLDALAAEGIYINLNLHVGYTFRPTTDQLPAWPAGQSFPTQSKPLHIFVPRMVQLQEEYTRKVIQELRLKDDPVWAMTEIDNESSLLYTWQNGSLPSVLPEDYGIILLSQWNEFLRHRYASTDTLRAAWGADETDGPQILNYAWQLEIHSPAKATMESFTDSGNPAVRVNVSNGTAVVILKQVGFSIQSGQSYVAEFDIRAALPAGETRSVYWDIKQDVSPWRTITNKTVSVTTQWQTVRVPFKAAFDMNNIGRFGLSVEKVEVPLEVRRWSLRPQGLRGLRADETLEAGSVALVQVDDASRNTRMNDMLLFLEDRDRDYLQRMMTAIRKTGGDPLHPVTGTQIGFGGGLMTLDSHRNMNYLDHHFYIDHYNFPNVSWDGRDWRMRDSSSVGSGLSSFLSVALGREAGRPYTVSEFNQPWPNRQAAEIDPTLAAFAAFQDWDGIVHFAYEHSRSWDDRTPRGFNLNGDASKMIHFGQAAWLFRSGAIQPGRQLAAIPVSQERRLQSGRQRYNGGVANFLRDALGLDSAVALLYRVGLVQDETASLPDMLRQKPVPPYRSDTGEIYYDPQQRLMLLDVPQAAGVFGFTGSGKIIVGPVAMQLETGQRDFVSFLLTALDNLPLSRSQHLLLTAPGYTLRTQPGTTPDRAQRLVNYPGAIDWWTLEQEPGYLNKPSGNLNAGQTPVWMERVACTVELRTSAGQLSVYPLDERGHRREPLAEQAVLIGLDGYRIQLNSNGQNFSPWFELEFKDLTSRRR